MTEQRRRPVVDPVAAALAFAIREAVRLEAEARASRRRTIRVVDGGKDRAA